MAETEAIPDEVMSEARRALASVRNAKARRSNATEVIARLILASEARGREQQKEADARIADEYAAQKIEDAPFQGTDDRKERLLVYAKHARRIAGLIRFS